MVWEFPPTYALSVGLIACCTFNGSGWDLKWLGFFLLQQTSTMICVGKNDLQQKHHCWFGSTYHGIFFPKRFLNHKVWNGFRNYLFNNWLGGDVGEQNKLNVGTILGNWGHQGPCSWNFFPFPQRCYGCRSQCFSQDEKAGRTWTTWMDWGYPKILSWTHVGVWTSQKK